MNNHTTMQTESTEEFEIVKIKLPLNDTFQTCYSNLNLEFNGLKSASKDMINNEVVKYEKELFSSCQKSAETFISQMFQNWTTHYLELRYVFRIYPSIFWYGELVVEKLGQNNEIIHRNIIQPSKQLVNCYHMAEIKVGGKQLIISYILMKIIMDFNQFYKAKGRLFPAYIEIVL